MNKLLGATIVLSCAVAHAQPAKADKAPAPAAAPAAAAPAPAAGAPPAEMAPPKAGAESDALKPFVHNFTSAGTIVAGAMGKNPELPTKGKASCKWILDNLWATCEIEDVAGTGKTAMKWQGHWVFGWDFLAKGYRGTMTSSMGSQMQMKGTLEGTKITWENMVEMKMPGMPSKSRISLDAADPKAIKFTEEGWVGGKWVPMSSATHKLAAK